MVKVTTVGRLYSDKLLKLNYNHYFSGLAKPDEITASVHPADVASAEAFKVNAEFTSQIIMKLVQNKLLLLCGQKISLLSFPYAYTKLAPTRDFFCMEFFFE